MRRARRAHDVVDPRRVEARARRTPASPRRAAGASSCALRPQLALRRRCAAAVAPGRAGPRDLYDSATALPAARPTPRRTAMLPATLAKPPAASAIVPPTSPSAAGRCRTPTSTASPTRSRSGCAAAASARATSSRSCSRPGPSTSRVPRGRQARRDHRRGQRPPHRDRARRGARPRRARARARGARVAPTGHDARRGRRRRRPPTRCCATLRVAGDAPPPLPDDPDRPVAIIFTSGTTGLPKGALYCNRQLAFITQTDVGDTWDGGGRSLHRHVVRAPRLHDQAARQPAARRHDVHHGRAGAPTTRSSCSRASA